ncbi:MAG: spore germination protein [Peptococcaceae bacterium]
MKLFKRKFSKNKKAEEISPREKPDISSVEQTSVAGRAPRAVRQLYKGAKQLYSENLEYNLRLLRHRLPDPNLVTEEFIIGSRSQTKVAMAYLQDVANTGIAAEIKDRLSRIKAEIIPDSSYIERNIQDSTWSPFPQVEIITNVNVTLTALTQGRIAIFTDNCPDILIAPTTFFDILDTPEDAYRRWFVASTFFRIARFLCFIIATLLPSFYIALTAFNPELIPSALTFTITAAREGTPFPIYLEAFILMGVAEVVRMVMLRMPNTTGQSISIFAGITLVLTGLITNIISGPIIIIVGLAIISSFTIPGFDLRSTIRILQFFTMLMATLFGLFGVAVSLFYIFVHLSTLKSFGIPYMAPLSPTELSGWGHTIFRKSSVEMPQDETYKPQKK